MAVVLSRGQYLLAQTGVVTSYPFTISCWFKPTGASSGPLISLGTNDSGNNDQAILQTTASTVRFSAVSDGGASANADTSSSYITNQWQHACAVGVSATSRYVFLNAAGSGGITTTRVLTLNNLNLGVNIGGGVMGSTTGGTQLAEPAIWSTVLTFDEIRSLASGFSPQFIRPENLVFYTPMIADISQIKSNNILTGVFSGIISHPKVYGR